MENTSIILCSGAWHTNAHIEPVIPYFIKAGYRIVPQTLLSAGAQGLWEEDVNAVQSTILAELRSGRNVVLILHSLAGLAGFEAVNRIGASTKDYEGKIVRIIPLASFIDVMPITEHLIRNDFIRPEMEKGISWTNNGEVAFYNDISPEKAKPFIDALTSQAFYAKLPDLSSGSWRTAAPLTYLMCNQDSAVPSEFSESFAAEYGMDLVRMDAGHCPYTSQPEKFVEVVDKILRA